ncbi:MAG TPA: FecR family protein [Methylomirabilota bacterium]|nr:FecR family protein [Methylomirabilota bacterium]
MSTARGGLILGSVLAAALALGGGPRPAEAQGQPVGTAQNAVGTLVIVRTDGIEHRLQGKGALPLFEGDVLRTEAASQASIVLRPSMPVALNEKTSLKILSRWDKSAPGNGTIRILRVSRGEVWARGGGGERQIEIETPASVTSARDAEIDVKVADDGQSTLTVVQGTADFATPFGQCSVRGGTVSIGARGASCTAPQPANAAAAVGWKQAVSP